ncbi:MAG: hypothetical protein IKR48_10960 [Kiritimatiellae bacterium]|nr:hypothetical protein [Kiritimatiellia bacterium]
MKPMIATILSLVFGTAFARTVNTDYTLVADEDWTGDGTVELAHGTTIDLAGHKLTAAGFSVASSGLAITNETGTVAGYSDLSYLDTSGGQRIETDFLPECTDTVEMGVRFHEKFSDDYQFLWCSRPSTSTNMFCALKYGDAFRFDRGTNATFSGVTVALETDYTIVADYETGAAKINTKSATTMVDLTPFTVRTNLVLFASFKISSSSGLMTGFDHHADIRFYYLRVFRAGVPVAYFVPAVRQSDGMIGVYDRIANKFYENAGPGGPFTAESPRSATITSSGSGVPGELHLNIPRYQELDYIATTNNQWLQTDCSPNKTDRMEMKVQIRSNVNGAMFCSRNGGSLDTFSLFYIKGSSPYFRLDHGKKQNKMQDKNPALNTDYEIQVDGNAGSLIVNNESWGSFTPGSFTGTPPPIMLFASCDPSSDPPKTNNFANCRCYYFRVYDSSGNLRCDMIPARDMVTGQYGMYDRTGDKFYTSPVPIAEYGEAVGVNASPENGNVEFTGNLKLVKEGGGVFTARRENQTYTGGTEVADGMLVCGTDGSKNPFGADGGAITVSTGGTFHLNGKYPYGNYPFVLSGGVLTNSADVSQTQSGIGSLRLTEDSSIVLSGNYTLGNKVDSVWSATLDLGGNKLTITTPSSIFFRAVEAVSAGTIELHGPRIIAFTYNAETDSSDLRLVNLIVTDGSQIRARNNVNVKLGGYVSDAEAQDDSSSYGGKFELYGTFKPNTDYFHGLEIQSGATIDISGRTTPLPCQSRIGDKCVANAKNITFADGAIVHVSWGDRVIPPSEPLISWTAETKPSNLGTLRFIGEHNTGAIGLIKMADGVYQSNGLVLSIR